ncbi:hypothetical protein [Chitinolyticbacter meiyuanensis]|uniref:hypothetical protein n=1 Tax=Chitinolyticbacter meiyuanensis TaxID=682798 RepID=UPI0011E59044|nr:hypothetical protein [Chitinolyticbacter meiyuanensis]
MPRILIGLTGQKGAGKDTSAMALLDHGFIALAFADALREEVCFAFGIQPVMLTARASKEEPNAMLAFGRCRAPDFVQSVSRTLPSADVYRSRDRSEQWLANPQSARRILQLWGDWRRSQNPHYFIDRMQDRLDVMPGRNVVITDIRCNPEPHRLVEPQFVLHQGGEVWNIHRPGLATGDSHITEQPIPQHLIERIILNDGTVPELHGRILIALQHTQTKRAGVMA